MHTSFWWKNPRKRYHLEDQDVNEKMVLREESSCECYNDPSPSIKSGNCMTENILASQQGLCFMELVS